ncbi:hypothetical protein KP509_04G045900 [Ceratopteris richardii]|uniref:Uncharacterized protein n=1 Tax=Ceratopteris richardii TaxID=49495 RepID=A0A8T2UV22_CERRI|nr:hypothetical protein KP509_04G045900 [Ceratopteris richardii]
MSTYRSGAHFLAENSQAYNRWTSHDSREELVGLSLNKVQRPNISFTAGTSLAVLLIVLGSLIISLAYYCLQLKKSDRGIEIGSPSEVASTADTASTGDIADLAIRSTVDNPFLESLSYKTMEPDKMTMAISPPVVFVSGEGLPCFIAVPCPLDHKDKSTNRD